MAEVTDEDRARAAEVLRGDVDYFVVRGAIAVALAEERERASWRTGEHIDAGSIRDVLLSQHTFQLVAPGVWIRAVGEITTVQIAGSKPAGG